MNEYKLASLFHEIYEVKSDLIGWKTQKECKVPFTKLPKENQEAMILTCREILRIINNDIDELVNQIAISISDWRVEEDYKS